MVSARRAGEVRVYLAMMAGVIAAQAFFCPFGRRDTRAMWGMSTKGGACGLAPDPREYNPFKTFLGPDGLVVGAFASLTGGRWFEPWAAGFFVGVLRWRWRGCAFGC